MQPIIEISNLGFDYPGFRALNGVNLAIEAGTVTALVGPNGAGKTTLLRCIAALEIPTEGTVKVAGFDVCESPREVHRRMGFLSDNFGLYTELTVAQGLEYAARSQGLDDDSTVRQAVQHTAKRMGLGDKLGLQAGSLSRGQRQRLAIGQSIIHSPQVLLLDEPASGLDPEARALLTDVFKSLQADGMSLLVSSHILAELDQYSTHMLALNQGQVLEHRALHATAAVSRKIRMEFVDESHTVKTIEVVFSGDAQEQADLLAKYMAQGERTGKRLVSFYPVNENLQNSYLESLRAQRSQRERSAS